MRKKQRKTYLAILILLPDIAVKIAAYFKVI